MWKYCLQILMYVPGLHFVISLIYYLMFHIGLHVQQHFFARTEIATCLSTASDRMTASDWSIQAGVCRYNVW